MIKTTFYSSEHIIGLSTFIKAMEEKMKWRAYELKIPFKCQMLRLTTKYRNVYTLICLILFCAASCDSQKNNANKKELNFEVGQTWNYKTRSGEENSTLTILKIGNRDSVGKVFIVSIDGIKLKNPIRQYGKIIHQLYSENIPELALTEEAFLNSITTQSLIKTSIATERLELLKKYNINIDSVSGLTSEPVKEFLKNFEERLNKE